MDGIVIALMLFCIVLLVVSIIYIFSTLKHKERMALLASDKEQDFFDNEFFFLNAVKWGLILFGAGFGFLMAFLLSHNFVPGNEGEPLYPACILMGSSFGLLSFYFRFRPRK
ncbi:MAG: DUF6249 domain-containing protein [Cyclobacteriaceae bacterium]